MMPVGAFVPFGPDHLGILAFTVVSAGLLVATRDALRGRDDRRLRQVVAGILIGNELIELGIAAATGRFRIPLQLCDLTVAITVWALVSLRMSVVQLAYFWGLGASMQAVMTPDLRDPFPTYWWFAFFLNHCVVVLSAVYLSVTGRVQPTQRAVWRAWGWAAAYVIVMLGVDAHFGVNYGYLLRKPSHPSLLDHFGPWPQYVFVMSGLGLALFYVCYWPFAVSRWWVRWHHEETA